MFFSDQGAPFPNGGYSQYEPDGISYVERSTKKTTLMKIEIEHMTGKRGISKNKEIRGKQQ